MKKDIEDHYPSRRQWQAKAATRVLDKIAIGSYQGTPLILISLTFTFILNE
jgi:hypothetical protein